MNEESLDKKIRDINVSVVKDVILDFVFPLIGLAVTILLFFLYIKPTYTKINEMKAELDKNSVTLETLNAKSAALTKMKDYNTVLQENVGLVEKLLVSESSVPQLLDEIQQIATNAGMEMQRLNYSYTGSATDTSPDATANVRKEDVAGTVNVSLSVKGGYDQMVVFMQEIEKAARLAFVTTFRFGAEEADANPDVITANINVDSPYMFVQSSAVTDDPVTLDVTSPQFVTFMNSIKDYKVYEFLNPNIKAEEVEAAKEESAPVETTTEEEPATPFSVQ